MTNIFVIVLIAVVAVGVFVLALSLTLIFKGHHIDSEIGDNKHMQARGIRCAAQQIKDEERALHGVEPLNGDCITCKDKTCGTC